MAIIPRFRASNFMSFWSTATAWGTFTPRTISVLAGALPLRPVELSRLGELQPGWGRLQSAASPERRIKYELQTKPNSAILTFPEPIEIKAGEKLTI